MTSRWTDIQAPKEVSTFTTVASDESVNLIEKIEQSSAKTPQPQKTQPYRFFSLPTASSKTPPAVTCGSFTISKMMNHELRLSLSAGETLPNSVSWMIEEGYLIAASWSDDQEYTILGLWGPGELVIPRLITIEPLRLVSLSAVELEQCHPSKEEEHAFQQQLIQQLCESLRISHIKSADQRLLQLMLWIGERYGRVSSRGVSLSLTGMNLTHRNLALLSGLTRVTVTKALSRFRDGGQLFKLGEDELLATTGRKRVDRQG